MGSSLHHHAVLGFLLMFLMLFCLESSAAFSPMTARQPPCGWNSWNAFGTEIDEGLIKDMATLMNDLGLMEAGYTYLNIDDAWHDHLRTPSGRLQPHPVRFASGIPSLVKHAADRGLQLGLYTDVGALTCAGYPGSLGHEEADADSFADWGISYLKVDNCWADQATVVQRYKTMGAALNATGAPLVYSLCSWGVGQPWRGWGRQVGGNSWRTSADISASWGSVLFCLDTVLGLAQFAGPGGWNDPDMLEVGNGDLTLGMQRAHFALWAVIKAPLLIGADLRRLATPQGKPSLDILLAHEVIAVNQDELGVAGDLVVAEGTLQVWAAPLSGGARAVVMLNRGLIVPSEAVPDMTITWEVLGYDPKVKMLVRDLFKRQDLALAAQGSFTAKVPPGDCLALRLEPAAFEHANDSWRPWHVTSATVQEQKSRNLERLQDKAAWAQAQGLHRQGRAERAVHGRARDYGSTGMLVVGDVRDGPMDVV